MAFDADAYVEALSPPKIKIGGRWFTGQFISIEDWAPFESRLTAFQSAKEQLETNKDPKLADQQNKAVDKLINDFCNLAFPSPWYQLFNPWHRSVAYRVLTLPPIAKIKATLDFFESQARALNIQKALEEDPT